MKTDSDARSIGKVTKPHIYRAPMYEHNRCSQREIIVWCCCGSGIVAEGCDPLDALAKWYVQLSLGMGWYQQYAMPPRANRREAAFFSKMDTEISRPKKVTEKKNILFKMLGFK